MQRLVTGIKPTGDIHIGNYFGVMRHLVAAQDQYDCFVFVADLHALNQVQDRGQLERDILTVTKAYLACGLDPAKVTLFQQSRVPAHAELSTILASLTGMGLLERAHAFKDAQAKQKQVNAGLFMYPVLMAADILAYNASVVPVGPDQKQHLEITRELAARFNHIYGETFHEPQPLLREQVSVLGLDGQKMSKSYQNVIGLFDAPDLIRQKVMRIVTDSKAPNEPKDPETDTLFAFHRLVSGDMLPEIERRYRAGEISYKESKGLLADNLVAFLAPIQLKKQELDAHEDYVKRVLFEGSERAAAVANQTLTQVLEKTGLRP